MSHHAARYRRTLLSLLGLAVLVVALVATISAVRTGETDDVNDATVVEAENAAAETAADDNSDNGSTAAQSSTVTTDDGAPVRPALPDEPPATPDDGPSIGEVIAAAVNEPLTTDPAALADSAPSDDPAPSDDAAPSVEPAPAPTAPPAPTVTDIEPPEPPEAASAPPAQTDQAQLAVAAPRGLIAGESFEIQIAVPQRDVAGYETFVGFDASVLTFVGARVDGNTSRIIAPEVTNGVALAVFSCGTQQCSGSPSPAPTAGLVTMRFIAERAGSAQIALSATHMVDGAGTTLSQPAPTAITLDVETTGAVATAPLAPWTSAAPGSIDASRLDVTGDGSVQIADVTELVLGWRELRWQATPCTLTKTRLAALDVDGNGCLDIADVQATAGAMELVARLQNGATPGLFVVDTTSDDDDADLTDLVCATAGGQCSLRAAIAQANWKVGPDRIEFAVPGSGPHTIALTDRLPTINDPTGGTVIDGYTQPGSAPNTDPLGSNAVIQVQIQGEGFVNGIESFVIAGPDNEVWGLAIYESWRPFELIFEEADGNVIAGNFIGTDAAGTFAYSSGNRGDGLNLNLGPDRNQIGHPSLAGRNVISGNGSWGLRVNHGETSQNRIQNNIIGLNPDGTDRLEQRGGIDVQWWTWGNLVGGFGPYERNVFSGLTGVGGIDFSHSSTGNQALGNYVGTDLTGDAADTHTANNRGISIKDNPIANHIEGNIIGNAFSDGIWHKHNYNGANTFVNNRVGVGVNGGDIGNGRYAMFLTGHDDTYYGNTFANSGSAGIYISDYNDTNPNHSNYPPERTAFNAIHESTFFANSGLDVDLEPLGQNANDPGDTDTGTHDFLNYPEITSASAGEIVGTVCPNCTVEVYMAGTVQGDGTIDLTAPVACTSRIEAEAATASGNFAAVNDASASGGQYMEVPDAGSFLTTPNANNLSFTFNAPTAGDYTLWGGVRGPSGDSDSFFVLVDGQPANGYLWDVAGGTNIIPDQVNDRTLGDLTFTLSAGNHTVEVHQREDGTGLDWLELRCGGAVDNRAWVDTVVADGSGNWSLADARIVDGAVLSALAIDLDDDTSEMSPAYTAGGTPSGGAGSGNGAGETPETPEGPPDFEPFVFTCSVDENDLLTWNQPNGVTSFFIRQIVGGVESYLTSVSNALELQLDPGADTMIVQYFRNSQPVSTSCDGPGPVTFTCSVTGYTLSWDDNGAATYYVRQIIGGNDTYLGETSNTSYQLAIPADTMRVFYWAAGQQVEATCDGPTFECSVTGFDLTWSDAGASTYYIRQIVGGNDTYVGQSSSTSFTLSLPADTIRVFYWASGQQIEAQCDGPVAVPFECSVTGFDLTWTDAGAATYYIRQIIGGNDTYVGSTSATIYTLTNAADTIRVFYWASGQQIEAQCDGPVAVPFECSVTGFDLTWTDAGASSYYIRQIIGGNDTYVGETSATSYTLTNAADTIRVFYWASGQQIEAQCDGPVAVPFECSVTGFDLTWTDAGASTYYIRQIIGGNDTYVGETSATSYTLATPADTIRVFYWASGQQIEAQCTGPVFECQVTGFDLTWTDAGASTYFIRQIIGGNETYLGSATSQPYVLSGAADTIVVLYWLNGQPIETTCDGPV